MKLMETVWITGGLGCIGAHATRYLLDQTECQVVISARRADPDRLRRVLGLTQHPRLSVERLDITDPQEIAGVLTRHSITRVIHLAALQTPDCQANRDLGLQTNLAGTQHLLEAIKRHGDRVQRVVFASSIAVYGHRSEYPPGPLPETIEPRPVNVYGVWKLAAEHLCRIFVDETGISTVCLRPGVLFGPGRDRGLTSTPTTAMKHLVKGHPYTIPFRNRQDYLYAPDVGAQFALTAVRPWTGFGVFTLPSHTVAMAELVEVIQQAAKAIGLPGGVNIGIGADEVPFICDLQYDAFTRHFPGAPHTPLRQAIEATLSTFATMHRQSDLD
ncbi:MAG: NAD(P)-dependent oxidoreductase [Planctomycetota bacterium]|nr:MAG: NAD(P)-dependent oxidoreductase [Planctomycetota bacterium]